jgi:hypothetical protein
MQKLSLRTQNGGRVSILGTLRRAVKRGIGPHLKPLTAEDAKKSRRGRKEKPLPFSASSAGFLCDLCDQKLFVPTGMVDDMIDRRCFPWKR